MAQLVEGDRVNVGAREHATEAFAELRRVEDVAGQRVREDEIALAAPARSLEVTLELAGQAIGERDGAAVVRLGRVERPARVGLGHPDSPRAPVDVKPAQPEELALAQASHRGRQVERALDRPELVLRNSPHHGLKLLGLQEADPTVR
jgi:hypothetical protein